MDIKQTAVEIIKERISQLKAQERFVLSGAEDTMPSAPAGIASFMGALTAMMERRKELENIIRQLPLVSMEPPAESRPEPIRPLSYLKERSPEETEDFHDQLIHSAIDVFADGKNGIGERIEAFRRLKKLNQYFVNITSLIHVEALIEKLEEIERKLEEVSSSETTVEIAEAANIVDRQLHQAHKERNEFAQNMLILQKELNLPE